MKTLLLILAIAVPVLGLYDLAHANGSVHHNTIDGSAEAVNEGNNQALGLDQNINLKETSLVNIAPALSANGVDCSMESRSYSILVWSYGRSKCEKGSIIWRDYARIVQIAGPLAAMGVACQYKAFRKVAHLALMEDGTIGVDCRKLRKQLRLHGVHFLRD